MSILYRRLNPLSREIRLVEIQPSFSLDDPIKCRLITVRHHDRLDYIALSSLYGDPSETETIYVSGRPIITTSHLAQGLKHVRSVFYPVISQGTPTSRTPRWLKSLFDRAGSGSEQSGVLRVWIDFLCINQSDEGEKSKQLVDMKHIFQSADIVVGWLGEKLDCTDTALKVMVTIHEAIPEYWGQPGDRRVHPEDYSPTHKWAESIMHLWAEGPNGEEAHALPHWVGCVDFMTRPYFQRRWILMEIATASFPAFLIGDSLVPWRQVLSLYRVMDEFKYYPSNIFPPHLKAAICELPLETSDKLLDEFAKREALEEAKLLQDQMGRRTSSVRSSWSSIYR